MSGASPFTFLPFPHRRRPLPDRAGRRSPSETPSTPRYQFRRPLSHWSPPISDFCSPSIGHSFSASECLGIMVCSPFLVLLFVVVPGVVSSMCCRLLDVSTVSAIGAHGRAWEDGRLKELLLSRCPILPLSVIRFQVLLRLCAEYVD